MVSLLRTSYVDEDAHACQAPLEYTEVGLVHILVLVEVPAFATWGQKYCGARCTHLKQSKVVRIHVTVAVVIGRHPISSRAGERPERIGE